MAEPGQLAFYFDLASPECYLAAERIMHALPGPLDWRPVRIANGSGGAGRALPSGARAAGERARACCRCAGRALCRSTASPRCSPPPTRARSAAASPSRRRPFGRRSPAAITWRERLRADRSRGLRDAPAGRQAARVPSAPAPRAAGEATNEARRSGVTALPAVVAEKECSRASSLAGGRASARARRRSVAMTLTALPVALA